MAELSQHESKDFQYAIVIDELLESYTLNGWEFVKTIDVPGTEMVHQVRHFEHPQPAQGGYVPPPQHSSYSDQSGQVIRWSMVKVLLRRPRDVAAQQSQLELDYENMKALNYTHEAAIKNLEAALDDGRKQLKLADEKYGDTLKKSNEYKASSLKFETERDTMKKQFETIELDIGKREMDRILGRFPTPVGAIDLGDDKT